MSCSENEPNILQNNCDFITGAACSNITTTERILHTHGETTKEGRDNKCLIKVPRFIGQVEVEVCIIDDIQIPEGFSEVKEITRQVIVTQAKLVRNQLLVEGFIIKNIRFVTPNPRTVDTGRCIAVRNTWNDISVKVPFSFCTKVEDIPRFGRPKGENEIEEFDFKCNTMKDKCCDKGHMGESLCETLRVQKVTLNEVPFADLVKFEIAELDISRKPCPVTTPEPTTNLFTTLTEKILLKLTINLFINEFACAASPSTHSCDECEDC